MGLVCAGGDPCSRHDGEQPPGERNWFHWLERFCVGHKEPVGELTLGRTIIVSVFGGAPGVLGEVVD